jgi:hypothetical protein
MDTYWSTGVTALVERHRPAAIGVSPETLVAFMLAPNPPIILITGRDDRGMAKALRDGSLEWKATVSHLQQQVHFRASLRVNYLNTRRQLRAKLVALSQQNFNLLAQLVNPPAAQYEFVGQCTEPMARVSIDPEDPENHNQLICVLHEIEPNLTIYRHTIQQIQLNAATADIARP